ncbi:MAG: prepilin-type N-terminal cleavage/methylation domain-containing protein [Deltaproteobacteria bacterium]|nr:prepilin-type N-terminal cleavage/methylation domain-containing protein [Deltaproteobacteria bacterium]
MFTIKSNCRGMTLVEVVVVSLLLALLATALYSSLNGIIRSSRSIESQRETLRTARSVFSKMIKELNGAVPDKLVFVGKKKGNSNNSTNQSFVGAKALGGGSITFITTSGTQAVFGGAANYGSVQITYRLAEDSRASYNNPEIKNLKTYVLVREETPAEVTHSETLKKRRIITPIAADVVALNFRFMQKKKWKESWTSKGPPLPKAVEITITLASAYRPPETFRTAIALQAEGQEQTLSTDQGND